jgi:hypothetical protein
MTNLKRRVPGLPRMAHRGPRGRFTAGAVLAAVGCLTAGAAVVPVSAATTRPPHGTPGRCAAQFAPLSALYSVAAVAASNVWAVGQSLQGSGHVALAEHWNGTDWTQVPNAGGAYSTLYGVAFTSASDGWAVGNAARNALAEHWDGTAWSRSALPAGSDSLLTAVAATSATNAWAAGAHVTARGITPLMYRWNGRAWAAVAVPGPAGSSGGAFSGLAATSPSSTWAVGYSIHGVQTRTWTEHWDGTAWTPVASPNPGGTSSRATLAAVAETSPGNAWAVGDASGKALADHWNGTSWTVVTSGAPAGASLSGVSAVSPANAWVVGSSCTGGGTLQTLTEHWGGHAWTRVASPNPSGATSSALQAMAVTSPRGAWAVGWSTTASIHSATLIEHWDGRSWEIVPSP